MPEVSALDLETIEIDLDTAALLKALNFDIKGVVAVDANAPAVVEGVVGANKKK